MCWERNGQLYFDAEGVLAESSRDIIRSFCMQTEMNPGLKKPVGHIALSYSAVDAPKLRQEDDTTFTGIYA